LGFFQGTLAQLVEQWTENPCVFLGVGSWWISQ